MITNDLRDHRWLKFSDLQQHALNEGVDFSFSVEKVKVMWKTQRGQWVSFGRVLTPTERGDFEIAQELKRLLIAKINSKKLQDPAHIVHFVLVDKAPLRIRIDKTYYSVEEEALRYGISTEEITAEKARYHEMITSTTEKRKTNKRKAEVTNIAPSTKLRKV
ncbi:hypothetical protein Aduo_005838 [Ancylostoma duodenale]